MKIINSIKDIKEQGSFFCKNENILVEFELGYIWVYDLTNALQKGKEVALYRVKEFTTNVDIIMQPCNLVRYEDAMTVYSPFVAVKKIKKTAKINKNNIINFVLNGYLKINKVISDNSWKVDTDTDVDLLVFCSDFYKYHKSVKKSSLYKTQNGFTLNYGFKQIYFEVC